ncbi:hypothetical protein V8E51_006363 [Hyaloscypha variabilis]
MTSKTWQQPPLPSDIILCIIDFVAPTSRATAKLAYEPSHTITKTLLALTLTARITYPAARQLLYSHCLYIDAPRRLRCLLNSFTAHTTDTSTANSAHPSTQPTTPHETSLYLAPFLNDTIAELPTTRDVASLLSILAPTLHHIVIDIPLRSLHPEDDNLGIRQILYDAFAQLTSLESLCSARDGAFLNYSKDWLSSAERMKEWDLWPDLPLWPKLRLLALYNCDLTSDVFWRDISELGSLETLVLTRADGVREVDVRREWRRCGRGRELTMWFVDVDGGRGIPATVEWREGDKLMIRVGCVPTSYYGDENEIELCQDWIKRAAMKGEEGFKEELEYLSA